MRKAEVGFKGHIAPRTDFSVELDPVRPDDPFRRTYIRLAAHERLHMKCGIEKAPIGLEELGVHLESHWPRWLLQFAVTNGGRRLLLDDNANKAITARIVWAPHAGLSLGSAAMLGEAGQERRARDRYNAEFKIGSNMTGAQAEFFRARDGSVWSSAYYSSAYALLPAWNNLFGTQRQAHCAIQRRSKWTSKKDLHPEVGTSVQLQSTNAQTPLKTEEHQRQRLRFAVASNRGSLLFSRGDC